MVPGWMEEDEDDRRTFGILPEKMTVQVMLEPSKDFKKTSNINLPCNIMNTRSVWFVITKSTTLLGKYIALICAR
jgi:hypothetical protein